MTETNAGGEVEKVDSVQEKKFVPVESYQEVSRDMHKYKEKLKEEAAKAAELKAKLEQKEIDELAAQKKWEDLYKQTNEKLAQVSQDRQSEREKFLEAQKIGALLQELGGVAKRDYIKHANLKAIDMKEDGSIDEVTLKKEAERFRQDHFVLLNNAAVNKIPQNAPKNETKPVINVSQMTHDQRKETLKELLAKSKG